MKSMQAFRIPAARVIALDEVKDGLQKVQLFRCGTFYHPEYGQFTIDQKTLSSIVKNFNLGIRGVDLAIDYAHENWDIAAGWIKKLELSADGMELYAWVEWTPQGSQKTKDKEYRYLSPEFAFNYEDNETLKKFGPTLLGAGLTNRPCIKSMDPVVNLSELKCDDLDSCAKELIPELIKEGHEQDQAVAIAYSKCRSKMGIKSNEQTPMEKSLKSKKENRMDPQKYGEMTPEQLAAMPQAELVKLVQELLAKQKQGDQEAAAAKEAAAAATAASEKAAKDAKEKADKESADAHTKRKESFVKLLTEGKVVQAQEESFLKGDVQKFVELSVPTQQDPSGSGRQESDEDKKLPPADRVSKLADGKLKDGKAKSRREAIALTLKENPELAKQAGYAQA